MKLLRAFLILSLLPLGTLAARGTDTAAKPAEKECCKDNKDCKECAAAKDKAKDKDSCCDDEKPADKAEAKKEAKK